ncbi:hypothetical protein M885DRAFT_507851 [Pelagophyceae sp. CCMP2097]|nr:hypothetical protein M885DRAFT_507851 [Pelagophyceae sp. CCMP2097]
MAVRAVSGSLAVDRVDSVVDTAFCAALLAAVAHARLAGVPGVDERHCPLEALPAEFATRAAEIVEKCTKSRFSTRLGAVVNGFVITYDATEESSSHAAHVDPNVHVTINVSLSDEGGYDGGELFFHVADACQRGDKRCFLRHRKRTALIHEGQQTHGAACLTRGRRSNLILWTRLPAACTFTHWRAAASGSVVDCLSLVECCSLSICSKMDRALVGRADAWKYFFDAPRGGDGREMAANAVRKSVEGKIPRLPKGNLLDCCAEPDGWRAQARRGRVAHGMAAVFAKGAADMAKAKTAKRARLGSTVRVEDSTTARLLSHAADPTRAP